MKGVILAGGYGTRLQPMTLVANKHLLPVYDRPMIYYPIQCLKAAGIDEILLVTGGNDAGRFLQLLGDGHDFGLSRLAYAYQEGAGGIAQALSLAERFAQNEPIVVILGDNIVQDSIAPFVQEFRQQLTLHPKQHGARILLKKVTDPNRFGVAAVDDNGNLTHIIEKPENPPTDLAVTGFYMFDAQVFDIIRTLEVSERGELEITDVNNIYMERNLLQWSMLDGWWADAGTTESLYRASTLVRKHGANGIPATQPDM